jgi:hypothetical protein
VGFFALTVILPYLVKKALSLARSRESPFWRRLERTLARLQALLAVAELVNYGAFILRGNYRSVAQRVLGMRMRFSDPTNKRVLNFSLMNRTLVWQVYELFLKTALPHVFAFAGGPLKSLFYMSSFLQPEKNDASGCIHCAADPPVMARQAAPCRHLACYYCAQTATTTKCPCCGQNIEDWTAASPDSVN